MARSFVDQIDGFASQKLGRGLPAELKSLATDLLAERFDTLISSIKDELNKDRTQRFAVPPSQGPNLNRWTFVISIVTAILLVLSLIVGSVVVIRITDRVMNFDFEHKERIAERNKKVIESETKHLELRAETLQAKNELAKHDLRLDKVEARQDALIIYLLESVSRLLKDRKIPQPDIPPILQIARAEIALKYGSDHE